MNVMSSPQRGAHGGRIHTHDFALADAEHAICMLSREIPREEPIHSCLIPPA